MASKKVYLIGDVSRKITGGKLPSNYQVLAFLFYNIRELKLGIRESANLVISKCLLFWDKAGIPTRTKRCCVQKLVDLHKTWAKLQKNSSKPAAIYRQREDDFKSNLNNLFDIAHSKALDRIETDEEKEFLKLQRQPGRPGYLPGMDKKLMKKEEGEKQSAVEEQKIIMKPIATTSQEVSDHQETSSTSFSSNEDSISQEDFVMPSNVSKLSDPLQVPKTIVTPKLVAALDKCRLSASDSVYIVKATLEALGLNIDDFSINQSSIERLRAKLRKSKNEARKRGYPE